eukprot:GHVN01033826.1.p1 GENE.GHVN01033826.1~~GHVN01033826.1.p1  ORF type:complete len:183 (+),score=39.93 GHVN01033826.1:177-725(+)
MTAVGCEAPLLGVSVDASVLSNTEKVLEIIVRIPGVEMAMLGDNRGARIAMAKRPAPLGASPPPIAKIVDDTGTEAGQDETGDDNSAILEERSVNQSVQLQHLTALFASGAEMTEKIDELGRLDYSVLFRLDSVVVQHNIASSLIVHIWCDPKCNLGSVLEILPLLPKALEYLVFELSRINK